MTIKGICRYSEYNYMIPRKNYASKPPTIHEQYIDAIAVLNSFPDIFCS